MVVWRIFQEYLLHSPTELAEKLTLQVRQTGYWAISVKLKYLKQHNCSIVFHSFCWAILWRSMESIDTSIKFDGCLQHYVEMLQLPIKLNMNILQEKAFASNVGGN